MKIISAIFFIIIFSFFLSSQIYAQNTYVKGGIGFYTFYEKTFHSGKISMSPTPILSIGLSWELSDLFSLGWENSFRLKTVTSEYIGIDTTTFKSGVKYQYEDIFFNFDSKAIGIFSLLDYDRGKIFALVGTGISVSLINELNYTSINQNVVLRQEYITDYESVIFSNSGIFTEVGVGAAYQNFTISTNFLIELFKATPSAGSGKISSSLVQINIIYNI